MTFFDKIDKVIRREIRIWARRPIYFLGSVAVMAFCTVFYLTFLGQGVPSDLPIAVVDLDGSSTSRNFCRQLDATQLGKVIHYGSFSEAQADMQGGRVIQIKNYYIDYYKLSNLHIPNNQDLHNNIH